MDDLDHQLDLLRERIPPPVGEAEATLVALLPCEPAIGDAAVACWAGPDGGELIELVGLEDGSRINDATALREALTLLAMVETMEELASFEELADIAAQLAAWTGGGSQLPTEHVAARDTALRALDALASLAPGERARVARPAVLDELGAALRELERAWELLEQAAELWSDAHLAARPNDAAALEQVRDLWRILGAARGGPLARPSSSALHAGREAGSALAAAVAEAARAGA